MCDDPWTSIIALQKRYRTLEDLAVIWVHGAGCVYGPNQDHTKRMIEQDLIFHDGAYKIDVLCDPSSPRAWTQTLASGARIMPGRTEFTSKVLCAVKARISTHAQVLLIGHSYGGLVASFVAQQLKDDPRASRLHVRTSGSMYTPTDFHDIVHYLFVDDVCALRYNWATPPKTLDGNAVYDPRQKIFWLRNYVVPDVKSMRNPVARQKAYDKVHAAHGWVMLKLLNNEEVLYPINERTRDDIEEMVDIAVHSPSSSRQRCAEQRARRQKERADLLAMEKDIAVKAPPEPQEDSIAPVPCDQERLEALETQLKGKASKAELAAMMQAYIGLLNAQADESADERRTAVNKAEAAAADAQMAADKAHAYSKKIEDVYAMKVATDLYHASAPSPSAPPPLPVSYAVGEPMMTVKKPSKKQVVLKRFFGVKAAA